VGAKSPDHVQKVEPLFNSKKKNYDVLNKKIKEREISKDKKIEYIKRIKNILEELKRTREERLGEIAQFFGIENSWEFDKMNFKEQGDFGNGL
jgi:flagellin-specific chaperone FliS